MKIPATLLICACFAFYAATPGHGKTPSASSLEALVSEYVQLRTALAHEKREWSEQQQHWESEIELLEAENTKLGSELQTRSEQESTMADEQAAAQARLATLDAAMDALPPLLDQAESRLHQWHGLIPPPLAESIDHAFRDIPADSEAAAREDPMRRLQRVMALYAQIEQMQSRIHVAKERLPVGTEARREVDVLYLGLARGFAVSTANDWAAAGYPNGSGWIWDPDPGLAAAVRRAITIHLRQADAQFVPLPMKLTPSHELATDETPVSQ